MRSPPGSLAPLACTALLILILAVAGCSSPAPAQPASPVPAAAAPAAPGTADAVTIQGFAFSPATLTITPGTTVTWTNRDSAPHTIVSADGAPSAFKSGTLATGDTYRFTFTAPGSYTYHCSIHPSMTGTIVVRG